MVSSWRRRTSAWRSRAGGALGFSAGLVWRMGAQGVRGGQLKAGRGSWACVRDAITAGIAGMIRWRKWITATAVARSRGSARELLEGRCVREAGRWVYEVGGGPRAAGPASTVGRPEQRKALARGRRRKGRGSRRQLGPTRQWGAARLYRAGRTGERSRAKRGGRVLGRARGKREWAGAEAGLGWVWVPWFGWAESWVSIFLVFPSSFLFQTPLKLFEI